MAKGNVFERIGDIMSSNIHALLDKCENPEKMLEQNMRNAYEDLAELKESAVKLRADQKAAQRAYDAALQKMQAEHGFAINAMKAGNEEAARKFLASEAQIKAAQVDPAKKNLDAANSNFTTVQNAYNKLASDIEFMKNQMNTIKSTMRTARATEKVAAMKDPAGGYAESFTKYADKAQRMLDEANAKIEMNEDPVDELDALRQQYAGGMEPDVSDALASLKAECGMDDRGYVNKGQEDGAMGKALDALKAEAGVQ